MRAMRTNHWWRAGVVLLALPGFGEEPPQRVQEWLKAAGAALQETYLTPVDRGLPPEQEAPGPFRWREWLSYERQFGGRFVAAPWGEHHLLLSSAEPQQDGLVQHAFIFVSQSESEGPTQAKWVALFRRPINPGRAFFWVRLPELLILPDGLHPPLLPQQTVYRLLSDSGWRGRAGIDHRTESLGAINWRIRQQWLYGVLEREPERRWVIYDANQEVVARVDPPAELGQTDPLTSLAGEWVGVSLSGAAGQPAVGQESHEPFAMERVWLYRVEVGEPGQDARSSWRLLKAPELPGLPPVPAGWQEEVRWDRPSSSARGDVTAAWVRRRLFPEGEKTAPVAEGYFLYLWDSEETWLVSTYGRYLLPDRTQSGWRSVQYRIHQGWPVYGKPWLNTLSPVEFAHVTVTRDGRQLAYDHAGGTSILQATPRPPKR